jgi:hypothetical protein
MPAPVFLVGAPRSGTTLLRVMLAGHPRLFSPPEMVLAPFATMAERKKKLEERFWEKGGLRRAIMELDGVDVERAKEIEASLEDRTVPDVYAWLQAKIGDRLLVDKCPHLAGDPAPLTRLARWFPEARWIWIVRHPGSVTRSIENMPMAEVMLQGYAPDARDIWHHGNKNLQRFLETVPADGRVMVRYEDLVADARPVMERIVAMLGVPFDEKLLTPYEGDRMREGPSGARPVGDPNMAGRGKIEPELATKWLEGFDPASVSPETHALARELGYDLGALEPPPITKVTAAMTALWDAARDIEANLRVPADLDAVEGRRFLLRLVAGSLDLFVEANDPDRPKFVHAEGPTRKTFADNPDADYWRAAIRTADGRAYRVSGKVPAGTIYTGILLYGRGGRVGNRLTDKDFVRADGSFSVTIATADPGDGTKWLKADGDETAVMVRQYFTDRAKQPPVELSVEPLFEVPPPKGMDALALAKDVEKARRNLEATFKRTVEAYKLASGMALNRFVPIGGEQLFPTPDNKYLVCWYRIGQDQTMLVRGRLPKARYVSFVLYNAWMESFDYEKHRIILNQDTMRVGPDGSFELQLAHRDLGHPNRLDTAGHLAGYLLMRTLLPEEELPVPTIEVLYEKEWLSRK